MSGLAGVLAGRVPPGAYRWHAAYDVDDVRHRVEHVGWSFAYVDGVGVESVPELHAALAAALGFPAHHGRNLDALHDSVSELDARTVVLWDAWGAFARAHERTFGVVVDILGGAVTVLLRGAGPDVDVPDLD